jgi:hypothetical protein
MYIQSLISPNLSNKHLHLIKNIPLKPFFNVFFIIVSPNRIKTSTVYRGALAKVVVDHIHFRKVILNLGLYLHHATKKSYLDT